MAIGTGAALAAAAAMAAAKTMGDAQRNKTQKTIQAATTRFSPWTGMTAAAPKPVDTFGNVLSSAGTALAMNQMNPSAAAGTGQIGGTLGNSSPWAGMDLQQPNTALGGSPWGNSTLNWMKS
jgi:hypothetical protein